MDKRNASRITSSRSLKGATFLLAGWRLSHPKELPGDLPVRLECHTLTMNTIVLQLPDAVADISMLQCSAQFRILFTNAHFVADNATHALASSATAKPTFNVEEEDVVIRNGWTPKEKERCILCHISFIFSEIIHFLTLHRFISRAFDSYYWCCSLCTVYFCFVCLYERYVSSMNKST